MKWSGYDEPEWEREHLLSRDGCHASIRSFWVQSGLNPGKKFYPDPDNGHRCQVCAKSYKRLQDLRAHHTRSKHGKDNREKQTATAEKDAILAKRKEMQKASPKVSWGDQPVKNCWHFKYLGSVFEAGGSQMPDVRKRIAMAKARFGKMRHIWTDNELHQNLRLRLYRSSVCSILTYGSEAWFLTEQVQRALNGANAQMMSVITGKSPR